MIKIKYSIWPYIKANGQVAIRVRWNSKQYEVTFITGVYADPTKWDEDGHKAIRGTKHVVRNMSFDYSEINERINDFRQEIELAFDKYSLKNSIPSSNELKEMVNKALGRIDNSKQVEFVAIKKKSMKQMLDWFLEEGGRDKNWDDVAKEKYTQAFQHLTKANPGIKPDKITVEHMYKLKNWYIKNEYRNRTINKQITMLKGFLKWINTKDGYEVPSAVLSYETNLKVLPKTVTFLHYDELLHFAHFKFEDDKSGRLSRARDYWCFMAFTSLRISDLLRLSNVHIIDGRIEMFAKKTGEHLYIPLTNDALAIIDKYKSKGNDDKHVFDIPSAQKLNDAIKDAAKAAGLDRTINEVYYIGTERKEESNPFCKIISNHDARRTFVSCSLAMGIPAETVMKCTGHKSYNTMKPYIETAVETQTLQMEKWNGNMFRSKIINLLDDEDENFLKDVLSYIQAKQSQKLQQKQSPEYLQMS
jgi:integrase